VPTERPGSLTPIAIIGIVLGSLGVLAALGGIIGLLLQDQLTGLQQTAQLPEAQRELLEQTSALTRAYLVPTMIAALANLVASIFLIVGGAVLLGRKPVAVGLMTKTVIAAIVVDLYSTALAIYMQLKTKPLTDQMMRATTAEMPPGTDAALGSFMSAAVWAGAVFTVFWLLCKLAYYIVAIVALKKPAVKAWFNERAAA
jgi:hypothetical protein